MRHTSIHGAKIAGLTIAGILVVSAFLVRNHLLANSVWPKGDPFPSTLRSGPPKPITPDLLQKWKDQAVRMALDPGVFAAVKSVQHRASYRQPLSDADMADIRKWVSNPEPMIRAMAVSILTTLTTTRHRPAGIDIARSTLKDADELRFMRSTSCRRPMRQGSAGRCSPIPRTTCVVSRSG